MTLVGLNGLAVPVPTISDQIRMLESFGRDKDRQRASALRALTSPFPMANDGFPRAGDH
jgi:hypothetical protein